MTPSSNAAETDRLLKDIVARRNVDLDISNDVDHRNTISKIINAGGSALISAMHSSEFEASRTA